MAKRDREFHQVIAEKNRLFNEELARRDATIEKLNQRCALAERELTRMKETMQTVKNHSDFNAAIIGMRLALVEGMAKSKSTQALILKDNPTEGEKRGEDQEKFKVEKVQDKGKAIVVSTGKELKAQMAVEFEMNIRDPDDSPERE